MVGYPGALQVGLQPYTFIFGMRVKWTRIEFVPTVHAPAPTRGIYPTTKRNERREHE